MSRILTVHLHHDPDDHWLSAICGASLYKDRCFEGSSMTRLAVLDLREATPKEATDAVELARSLACTLGVTLLDKDGEPWTAAGLDALTKELAA